MTSVASVIGVFARTPVPGRVKTRLCPPLTPESAARLYEAFLEDVLAAASAAGPEVIVLHDPSSGPAAPFQVRYPTHRLLSQRGADLGERLRAAFEALFDAGHERVTIIGSDAPTLPPEHLEELTGVPRARTDTADTADPDLVLGPALDGGYYGLTIRRRAWPGAAPLFVGIDWSTGRVLDQTLERAAAAGLHWRLAPAWYDIDRPEDLSRARIDARRESATDRALRSLTLAG